MIFKTIKSFFGTNHTYYYLNNIKNRISNANMVNKNGNMNLNTVKF